MSRTFVFTGIALMLTSGGTLMAASAALSLPKLSAAQIVDHSIAAQGGAQAWQAVKTLSWAGKMEAGGANRPQYAAPGMPKSDKPLTEQPQLPFVLEMQRPNKSRLELQFAGTTAVQVFDGSQGWKLRPYLNRNDVESFTQDELKATAAQAELDGLLVNYQVKGTRVELSGTESVEGQGSYKLKLTLKDHRTQYVWVDGKTFLQNKIEGVPRKMDGRLHPVSIYLSYYKSESGLMIPHLIETRVEDLKQVERIYINKVMVNPALNSNAFAKPQMTLAAAQGK